MSIFSRKKKLPEIPPYPSGKVRAVLRSSICTGEKTACFRNLETGKLHEILVIRTRQDLEEFGKQYGVDIENLKTIY